MQDPTITEVKLKGNNLFKVLNPDAKESMRVANFNAKEVIKNTSLDLDNPDFAIEGLSEVVIFSRKISAKAELEETV